jgi:flagellar protein FliO/FliZ
VLELAVRVGISLTVVLGLFWLAARAGSRRFSGGSRTLVRVRGRQSLSRTSSLAVVEVGSRVLVVGVSDGGVRLLTELDPTELEEPEAEAEEFDRPLAGTPAGPALSGSLLSAQTWKQAWAAAQRRERRTAGAHRGDERGVA